MRRTLSILGSLVVIAVVVVGVILFTRSDEPTTPTTRVAGASDPTSTTVADDAPSTTLAPRDGSLDAALGPLLLTPAEYGPDFTPVGPAPEEAATRCGTSGLDDPAGTQGRVLSGAENAAGTLSVTEAVRAYPDAGTAATAYSDAVAAIGCPLIELADGNHPAATGSEVGGLGADQSYAIDFFPDSTATAPTPIGGGFVARLGTRVLTLRYLVDPTDAAAVAFTGEPLAVVVRTAITKLAPTPG